TIPEAKRLARELAQEDNNGEAQRLAPSDFLEFSCQIDSKGTPHYPLLVREGGRVHEYFLILKRRQKKECVFLGEDSACGIYAHRPHVCRLYPFEFDGRTVKKKALCPIKFQAEGHEAEMARQLKEDLFGHEKFARKWIEKYGKQGIAPDMARFVEYFG
ncbi:YkgJ family cysteine cluster protein, partial [Candidatus Parvarchaeota archaeon]|nr:YkgJ family cysteine cluster protein [Candidatus Parvarchaeota archaeon]